MCNTKQPQTGNVHPRQAQTRTQFVWEERALSASHMLNN